MRARESVFLDSFFSGRLRRGHHLRSIRDTDRRARAPSRSKHFLRRYAVLKQRIASGEVVLKHVPDESMPADVLCVWKTRPKVEQGLRYMTGAF